MKIFGLVCLIVFLVVVGNWLTGWLLWTVVSFFVHGLHPTFWMLWLTGLAINTILSGARGVQSK